MKRLAVGFTSIMVTLALVMICPKAVDVVGDETAYPTALPAVGPVQAAQQAAEAEAEARRPKLTAQDMDQAISQVMSHYSAAGVTVATVEKGQLSQCGAWGWAVKNERPMAVDTKVRIASISKVVVGMNAMAMAEEGVLDLDAPLSQYWGSGVGNPYTRTQPTARTLMTHTSSVKDLSTTSGLSTLTGMLKSKKSWRNVEPGRGGYWYYSNFGFCTLGTTLELACGKMLDDYAQERFFGPLGIDASFYAGRLDPNQLATLYTTGGVGRSIEEQTQIDPPNEIGMGAAFYPGGLTISAPDMAKLVCVLANKGTYGQVRYLSEQSVITMQTPQFAVTDKGVNFEQCLVLRRQTDIMGQDVLYYHTGSAYGVFSLMTYNPDTGNGVVVTTTGTARKTNGNGLYALCAELSSALYQRMGEVQ